MWRRGNLFFIYKKHQDALARAKKTVKGLGEEKTHAQKEPYNQSLPIINDEGGCNYKRIFFSLYTTKR